MKRDVFQAIADPTRRAILNQLAHQSLNVNAVSEKFPVSRTAVYKHIKILTEAGLIVMTQHGRERFCEAKPERLNEVADWVSQYKKMWHARLDSLENYLDEIQSKNQSLNKKKKNGTK